MSLGMGGVAPVRIVDKSTEGHNNPENSKKERRQKRKQKMIMDANHLHQSPLSKEAGH